MLTTTAEDERNEGPEPRADHLVSLGRGDEEKEYGEDDCRRHRRVIAIQYKHIIF